MFTNKDKKKAKALLKSTLNNILKSGYITKQAKSGKASYNKRYFVLSANTLGECVGVIGNNLS